MFSYVKVWCVTTIITQRKVSLFVVVVVFFVFFVCFFFFQFKQLRGVVTMALNAFTV